GFRYLTGNESEGAFAETKQGRIRGPVANELVQRHAGIIRKIERGAIGEGDADGAIGSGLDRVVPVDRITDFDLGSNTAGGHDSDWADHGLDLADCLGRRGPHQLGAAANSAIITWRIADATEHATSLCCGVPSRLALPFLHDLFGGEFISSIPKLKKGYGGLAKIRPATRNRTYASDCPVYDAGGPAASLFGSLCLCINNVRRETMPAPPGPAVPHAKGEVSPNRRGHLRPLLLHSSSAREPDFCQPARRRRCRTRQAGQGHGTAPCRKK